jgi:hypothetical protein
MAAIEKDIIAGFGRELVVAVAPQEVPLFHSVSEAFFKDPRRARPRRRGSDDLLGFGTVEATLLTPIVLTIVTRVGMYLAEEIGKDIVTATKSMIEDHIKRLFRREPGAVSLQPPQLAEVRRIALSTAQQFAMPEANARELADVLVGRLAINDPT